MKKYVKRPLKINGVWHVIIATGPSLFAEEIERIPCGSREDAWNTYRQIKKELGLGF